MNCKRCGGELPENSRFCLTCGALQPMTCPSCQAESRPGSRTCSGCGKKLPASNSAIQFYKRKKTPGEIGAMVLLIVGSVLVLTAAILFLFKTLPDGSEPEDPEETMSIVIEDPEPKPSKDETSEDDPTEEEPTEDEPTADEPTEDEPTEEEPTDEEPDKDEPTEEDPTEEQSSEWIFPDSSERLLTAADIAGMDKGTLRIARNEIYARHGYIFGSADLKAYFNGCSWYKGTITKANFNEEAIFNDTEIANTQFLLKAEKG